MTEKLNGLKKHVFFELLNLAGRVFVLVGHSEAVVIGKRGFLPEEREKGLVLVFNKKMNFEWAEGGISAKLVFGTTAEQCFIPENRIISIFSPELLAQFTVSAEEAPQAAAGAAPQKKKKREKTAAGGKVVKVDFTKKK